DADRRASVRAACHASCRLAGGGRSEGRGVGERADRPRRRQVDDDRPRGAGRARRAALHPARRAGGGHQPEDAHPDGPPDGARRVAGAHGPPGGAAPGGVPAHRPGAEPGRRVLRRLGVGGREPPARGGRPPRVRRGALGV
ncbi:MAG: Transcriptional regulator, HxlR family, partial [uncultured Gemmatimonadaceae bacterium]